MTIIKAIRNAVIFPLTIGIGYICLNNLETMSDIKENYHRPCDHERPLEFRLDSTKAHTNYSVEFRIDSLQLEKELSQKNYH